MLKCHCTEETGNAAIDFPNWHRSAHMTRRTVWEKLLWFYHRLKDSTSHRQVSALEGATASEGYFKLLTAGPFFSSNFFSKRSNDNSHQFFTSRNPYLAPSTSSPGCSLWILVPKRTKKCFKYSSS